MMSDQGWRVVALLATAGVCTTQSVAAQGQADAYRMAASAYRQQAGAVTGARRSYYLGMAAYHDCLAAQLGPGGGGACIAPAEPPPEPASRAGAGGAAGAGGEGGAGGATMSPEATQLMNALDQLMKAARTEAERRAIADRIAALRALDRTRKAEREGRDARTDGLVDEEMERLLGEDKRRREEEEARKEQARRGDGAPCVFRSPPPGWSAWGHYDGSGRCHPAVYTFDKNRQDPIDWPDSDPEAPADFKPGQVCVVPAYMTSARVRTSRDGTYDQIGRCQPRVIEWLKPPE